MKSRKYPFNNDRSAIVLAWSNVNQAWFVYREDGDHQALLRIYNELEEAEQDYQNRVDFVKLIEGEAA